MADINIDVVDPSELPGDEDNDELEEVGDDLQELRDCVRSLETKTGEDLSELKGKIDACLTKLEVLSTTQNPQSAEPLLAQITVQLGEIQAELASVKLSMQELKTNPTQNELSDPLEEETPIIPGNPENADDHDGMTDPPKPKRRWT